MTMGQQQQSTSTAINEDEGNILHFTPHNFHQSISIQFPPQRLPVCKNCKKLYKTRDHCRVLKRHTALPWTTAYVCITLDESCVGMDDNGRYTYIHGQSLTARSEQHPHPSLNYSAKTELMDPKSPCCTACKKANRTRDFCRKVHKHRDLPWNTEFVVLSAADKGGDDNDCMAPHGSKEKAKGGSKLDKKACSGEAEDGIVRKMEGEDTDEMNINKIAPSRTFLCMVSTKQNLVQWLELGRSSSMPLSQTNKYASMDMQQQAAAAWQARYYQSMWMNQNMMMMQNQQPLVSPSPQQQHLNTGTMVSPQHLNAGTKRKTVEEENGKTTQNNNQGGYKPRKQGARVNDEVKAAIASATTQARAEHDAEVMRQQFVNGQMHMQRMIQMQVMQQQAIQMQRQWGIESNYQSEPRKKQKGDKKKIGGKEGKGKSSGTVDGALALPLRLPLVENPEEDGETLDWFNGYML